ncbi:MAG: FAD-dependent oxidoreductase [Acidimicrobiales bacterium]
MAAAYDIAIIGESAVAVALAWAVSRADANARVVVLAPRLLGGGADPADAARLHALRLPGALTPLVPRSAVRYRAWAEALQLDPPRVNGGHLVLATTVESAGRLRAAAATVPSCRALQEAERLELLAEHDATTCIAGWHEPLATTMLAGDLVFRLAEAAAAAGVDLVDGAAVLSVTRQRDGFELCTAAGTTRVGDVIDAEPLLAASRAAGLRGTVVAATHQRLVTAAMAPLLPSGVTVDDIGLSQRASGELDLVLPTTDPVQGTGLAAAASALATVVGALPVLSAAPVVRRSSHREAMSFDGLPIVGRLAGGWWVCGGLRPSPGRSPAPAGRVPGGRRHRCRPGGGPGAVAPRPAEGCAVGGAALGHPAQLPDVRAARPQPVPAGWGPVGAHPRLWRATGTEPLPSVELPAAKPAARPVAPAIVPSVATVTAAASAGSVAHGAAVLAAVGRPARAPSPPATAELPVTAAAGTSALPASASVRRPPLRRRWPCWT